MYVRLRHDAPRVHTCARPSGHKENDLIREAPSYKEELTLMSINYFSLEKLHPPLHWLKQEVNIDEDL